MKWMVKHLGVVYSVMTAMMALLSIWYGVPMAIATCVMGLNAAYCQYRNEKKIEQEKQGVEARLQLAEMAAEEVYNKPYYSKPITNIQTQGTFMNPIAPLQRRKVSDKGAVTE